MSAPIAVIVGASRDRGKYGNISLHAHRDAGYRVIPVNPAGGSIEGIPAVTSLSEVVDRPIQRVSLYVPPAIGIDLLQQIERLNPEEVWLNPGTESSELLRRARALGLPIVEGCSIVDSKLRPMRSG
ncbi:MAG: CoA-binding protein [Planctomycetaceae bacterium]|jgi:predicted CoA-binding protein